MATGAGRQLAAQHSHSLENWYAHVPGLRVFAAGTVQDARDLLRPLDVEAIVTTVRKTHRLVVIDEGWRTGSLAAEVVARASEDAFYALDAPPERVCSAEVPVPYAKHMEDAALPTVERIVSAARRTVGRDASGGPRG